MFAVTVICSMLVRVVIRRSTNKLQPNLLEGTDFLTVIKKGKVVAISKSEVCTGSDGEEK